MGMQNGTPSLGNSLAISHKVKHKFTVGPALTHLRIHPSEMKTMSIQRPVLECLS